MKGIVPLVVALVAGLGIGIFYFGGLWLTVRQLTRTRRPAILTLGSFLVRSGVSLLGFYLVMGGRWERLLASLLGFLVARTILVRWWQPQQEASEAPAMEGAETWS